MHPFRFTLIIPMDQQVVSVSIVHIFSVYNSDATCSLKAMNIKKCCLLGYLSNSAVE